jgi:hypothetical protein
MHFSGRGSISGYRHFPRLAPHRVEKRKRTFSHSPVPFPGHEPGNAFLPDRLDVLQVCFPVDRFEKVELFTGIRIAAFPAPRDLFFHAALPDQAEGRAATVPAPLFTPELHHSPKEFVTFIVIRKGFPERRIRDRSGNFFILCTPQFFPEIAGKVGDLSGIPMAVETAEPAIGDHFKILLFHILCGGYSGFYIFPRGVKMIRPQQNIVPDAGFSVICLKNYFPVFYMMVTSCHTAYRYMVTPSGIPNQEPEPGIPIKR